MKYIERANKQTWHEATGNGLLTTRPATTHTYACKGERSAELKWKQKSGFSNFWWGKRQLFLSLRAEVYCVVLVVDLTGGVGDPCGDGGILPLFPIILFGSCLFFVVLPHQLGDDVLHQLLVVLLQEPQVDLRLKQSIHSLQVKDQLLLLTCLADTAENGWGMEKPFLLLSREGKRSGGGHPPADAPLASLAAHDGTDPSHKQAAQAQPSLQPGES